MLRYDNTYCFLKINSYIAPMKRLIQLWLAISVVWLIALTSCEKQEQPAPLENGKAYWIITADTNTQVDYSFQFTDNHGTQVIHANSREPFTLELIAGGSYRIEWRTLQPHVNSYVLWNTQPSDAGWTRRLTIPATTF